MKEKNTKRRKKNTKKLDESTKHKAPLGGVVVYPPRIKMKLPFFKHEGWAMLALALGGLPSRATQRKRAPIVRFFLAPL